MDVIIPALNEAGTIGAIVSAFVISDQSGAVIVVDDMSTDNTGQVASNAGAIVIRGAGLGKGQAVMAGLSYVQSSKVVLCDADLSGFTRAHAEGLMQPCYGEIIGKVDGWFRSYRYSGERQLPTNLLRRLPLYGYAMEEQINLAVNKRGLPVHHVRLSGVTSKAKKGPLRQLDVMSDMIKFGLENR